MIQGQHDYNSVSRNLHSAFISVLVLLFHLNVRQGGLHSIDLHPVITGVKQLAHTLIGKQQHEVHYIQKANMTF